MHDNTTPLLKNNSNYNNGSPRPATSANFADFSSQAARNAFTKQITLETPFEQLVWMGPHNTLILDTQMCGRIGYETVDTSLGYLHLFPVCIEIDICGKSKIVRESRTTNNKLGLIQYEGGVGNESTQPCPSVYIDHYSVNFDSNPDNRRTGTYSSDTAYDERLSHAFSIEAVLTHIKQKYEVKQRQKRPLFPLILSMDISKISKKSDATGILECISDTFGRVFDGDYLFGRSPNQSVKNQPLSGLMGKVLLRINNTHGNVPKPDGASEKLKVEYEANTGAISFEGLKTANKTTHFTRVYPPVFADMDIKAAITKSIAKQFSGGIKQMLSSILNVGNFEETPEEEVESFISSVSRENGQPVQDVEGFDPFRLNCPHQEHVRYRAISEEMVELLKGNAKIFENVNCVAFNWHDLTDQSKGDVVDYFRGRYQGVVVSMSGATAPGAVELLTPPPSPPANFANFESPLAHLMLKKGITGGGKKRRKLKSRTKPKNKLIRKTRIIKRGGAKTNRRVLKSKKNRKSIKNKRSKKK